MKVSWSGSLSHKGHTDRSPLLIRERRELESEIASRGGGVAQGERERKHDGATRFSLGGHGSSGYGRTAGFTLIELMVVVLIISILVAIVIPVFLGLRDRAHDSEAKANLRNGATATQAYFTDNETYVGLDATALELIENNVPFADGDPPVITDTVYVSGVTADDFTLKAASDSGATFEAAVVGRGRITYNF